MKHYYLIVVFLFIVLQMVISLEAEEAPLSNEKIITLVFFQPDTTANPVEGNIGCQAWVDLVGERINCKMVARFFISLEQFENYINEHDVEIAILNPLYIIENYSKKNIVPVLVALRDGKPYYERVLVVRSDSSLNKLNDLKKKRLVTTHLGERTIEFIERIEFQSQLRFREFFKKMELKNNPKQCIDALLEGQADVAMIPKANYAALKELIPSLKKQTRSIRKFRKIPLAAACYFSQNISEAEAMKILDATVEIQNTPKGQQTLSIFQVEQWEKTSLDAYKQLEKMLTSTPDHILSQE